MALPRRLGRDITDDHANVTSDLQAMDYDPYWIHLDHAWRARLNLQLVLANVRVLFGLVMMRLSHAGDGATESMLVVARLGATTDHQGAVVDHPSAADDRQGAIVDRLGAVNDRQGAADEP
jgi:hypothetical protein